MGKTSKKKILKYSEKTSKKALSSVNKGLKKVGKTSKYLAKEAVPVVEKGVSEVYGTMATGFDLGVKGIKKVSKSMSNKKHKRKVKGKTRRRRKH